MRNQTLIVDIDKETCRVLKYKQYDNNNLLQIIVEKDDERVSLNGYTGYAFFKLPSGLVIKKDCSVQGSEVTINIDNNILSESGKLALDLTLSDGNRTFTLFRINLVIEEAIDKDDAIIVEAGWDIVSEIAKINKKIENLGGNGGNGGNNTDLSGYATKDELNNKADKSSIPTKVSQLENDKGYLTSVPSEYITETELNNKGYLTEHQDLSHLATKNYVKNEIANAQLGGGDTGIDLSGYATKDELNSKADKTEINSMASLIATLESQINALRSDVDSLLQNSGGGDSGDNIPCTSISIIPTSYTFTSIGQQYKLSANVTPSNTTDKILWSTTNSAIAQVTNGTVTSIGDGECIITATCGNYSDTCLITVNIEESVNTYSITNNLTNVSTNNSITSIEEGQSYNAILTCGNDYDISSVIVTMNGVDVTDSVYEPEYSEDPEDPTTIPCTSISLNKSIISFDALNTTQTLIATILPSDTTDTISWSSSATNIAKVNNIGVVTSIGNGSCTITATCGSKSDTCTVNVSVNSGSSDLYTKPIISFDTDTYRVNLTQDGYSETFYVSYARNEETPGYKGIKQFYDKDAYPYYLTLADQGSSKFRINGNIPVDGYCLYTGGYDGKGYFLDLTTRALQERNLNMQFKVSGLSQELVQDAMNHINNNAIGSAINFNITQSTSAPYRIDLVNIEDEVLGYNYTTQGYIQINEWMMNDYYGEFTTNDKRIFRRWRSTLVHELGHCLGFDDEAEHVPTMYNYYRDIEDDEAMCCLQANDWVFLETEFKNKLSFDLRTATTSTIPLYDLPNNELDIDAKKVKFTRPYYKDIDISNKADIILEGYLSYKETKELNVSKNEDKEVLIEYDIFTVTVKEFIKGNATDIEIKIPKNELSVNEESLYKLYLKQYNNTPCSPINLKQGIEKLQ